MKPTVSVLDVVILTCLFFDTEDVWLYMCRDSGGEVKRNLILTPPSNMLIISQLPNIDRDIDIRHLCTSMLYVYIQFNSV